MKMILSKPNYIRIYGHRGARGVLPENTLESFKYLFENNIHAYETDILISKDFIPVITHDFRLDPSYTKDINDNWIEDENIKIIDLTYNQILQFDVGALNKLSKYGRKFINQKSLENQKIPKLSELLKLTSDNIVENLLINLEIKSTPVEKNLTPEPDEMIEIIIDEVSRSNLEDRIIYSSFDWRILREIKERNSKIPRAYLTSGVKGKIYDKSPWLDFTPLHNGVELPELIKALGGSAWHPNYKDVNKEIVQISHDKGLPVNVWTVNRESDMLRMIDYGVDGIMTDYPLKLKELCERKNIKWF
ncbi:glycerophosphodiester phosphodiesterase family protein [Alphaproteobacteria bacterium]|nr:glycerophosphodiester phosphodiesterase family protein [Alphaproteobacteria bacterium]